MPEKGRFTVRGMMSLNYVSPIRERTPDLEWKIEKGRISEDGAAQHRMR